MDQVRTCQFAAVRIKPNMANTVQEQMEAVSHIHEDTISLVSISRWTRHRWFHVQASSRRFCV